MNLFVENLTLRLWFFSVLPLLLWDHKAQRARAGRCYVIDASDLALKAARWTARWFGLVVEKLAFRLVDVHDEEGLLIRLRIAYRDLAEVQAMAMEEPDFIDFKDEDSGRQRLGSYLAKSIATISLSDRGTLWRALLVIQLCAWKARKEGLAGARKVIFLERRPWMRAIACYASRTGVEISEVRPAFHIGRAIWWFLTPRGVAAARALRNRLWHWFVLASGKRSPLTVGSASVSKAVSGASVGPQSAQGSSSPKIAVEYSGHFNLERPELYSDLFFWQQSSLPGKNILLTFGFPQDPLDEEKWSELKAHGIAAVALYPGATTVPDVPFFTHTPGPVRWSGNAKTASCLSNSLEAKWLRQQAAAYESLRAYWRELFASQGAKIFITWYRYDARHCVMADALQELGGVTVIYQRACQVDPSAEITVDAEIMFGYSPLDAAIEKQSKSVIPYHVAVGYFGDHRFPLLREAAQQARNTLKRNGAEYIVAFFDENSTDDSRWHTGHEFQRENYLFLLEKLLAQPWLGLVLKPKYPPTLRRRLGPVAELLDRALATGRCFLYDTGPLHGSYPPAIGALAADVAIHGHLCAGSAGMEAALAGVPTLLLDREGWHVSLLYGLGLGRVVFKTWDELWGAIMEQRKAEGIEGFGNWSPLLGELDPFRDGRAAERMGTYLKWLIDGFKAGLDRETVMADAAERYCAIWGRDKVTEVNYPRKTRLLLPEQAVPLQRGLADVDASVARGS